MKEISNLAYRLGQRSLRAIFLIYSLDEKICRKILVVDVQGVIAGYVRFFCKMKNIEDIDVQDMEYGLVGDLNNCA